MDVSEEEKGIQEFERYLASAYVPIGPRQEFVEQLRQRIMDPAPKVVKAQSCCIELKFFVLIMSVLAAVSIAGFVFWKVYRRQSR